MRIIQANVSKRLLTKASRLFTGTLQGRIIEVLQNARRAGATKVQIINTPAPAPGYPAPAPGSAPGSGGAAAGAGGNPAQSRDADRVTVVVRDNGSGVEDFAKLLDLGASGWPEEETLEQSEDPAGVGLFCLAPRKVTVRSRGLVAVIHEQGWTGAEVEVQTDPSPIKGTQLQFEDEPWSPDMVKSLAVFTGMDVMVDGEPCPRERFIVGQAAHVPSLGCRIKAVTEGQVSHWHRDAAIERPHYSANVLVNFHGQVVAFDYRPVTHHALYFLVDLTGEPTGIRLMLPARTRPVENQAFQELKQALEREAFLYLQQQGKHQLPYREYLRAKELGIELPEAEPSYTVGLLSSDMAPEPVQVVMPKDHPLSKCYRLNHDRPDSDDTDEANVHLLAALGSFQDAQGQFVPVDIRGEYDGYGWASLPTVEKVQIKAGKVLLEDCVWSGRLICVDSLAITVQTSDGKTFASPVCMAVKPWDKVKGQRSWCGDYELYVTPQARQQLAASDIWYHLGGSSDEGDTYDTQEQSFTQDLDSFWARLMGPDEPLRARLMEAVAGLGSSIRGRGWRSVTILSSGCVTIHFKNGRDKVITPPSDAKEVQP